MNELRGANQQTSIVRIAVASWIGTSIEWYDFTLYGIAAALVLGPLFFSPTLSPLAAQLAAFATFWVGFAARPLGSIVFGHFGDTMGRKTTLVLTLLLMGIATFLMGCLPTYKVIGVWAAVLLVALRFLQGFAVGGEWAGAVLVSIEHAPETRRGFYGSWPQMGALIGFLLSTLVFSIVSRLFSKPGFLTLGWRIPFLLSIVLVGIGLFIRLNIAETPHFEQVKATRTLAKIPVIDLFRLNARKLLLGSGAGIASAVCFYIFSTFALSYGTHVLKFSTTTTLIASSLSALVAILVIPVAGALTDLVGRRTIFMGGTALVGLLAFPLFWLIGSKSPFLFTLALCLGMGTIALIYGAQATFLSELFGANLRYSGASLSYMIPSVLGGGLAPFLATWLLYQSHNAIWSIALYILVTVLISLLCTYFVGESRPLPSAQLPEVAARS